MKIGNVTIENGLFLAPMAGYSDRAMRLICKSYGAQYLTSEMVSAKAICYGDKKTPILASVTEEELPCAVQLFGSEPEFLSKAAAMIENGLCGMVPSAIDINMGCPVKKITANGEGSALLKNLHLIEKIVYAVKSAVKLPVTVKIRSGWDKNSQNADEAARAAESGGADAVFVHARTREQMYTGQADYTVIAKVKKSVAIPVIGNGDIVGYESAKRMYEISGCDGIMIGRGAIGRPFVFREILCGMRGVPYEEPSAREKTEIAIRQLELSVENKGERIAVSEARKQLSEYIKGISGAAAMRQAINNAKSYEEIRQILNIAEIL
ncbi:MAG: tRNA dihydrouridine synthase DusB [Eubacteriales bacterium]|nr:tRNA dihydrouridine synthase DusB [Eubacteriales bacterium]